MSTTEQHNPFESAEAWEPSTDPAILPEGNYVVTIEQAEDGTTKSANAYPQIELKFTCPEGQIRDWLNYESQRLGKVVALFDAAGVKRPQQGEFAPHDNCRLAQTCLDRLVGKKVGIVVRKEDDFKDPTKKRSRVQGYLLPNRITDDIPADTGGLPTSSGGNDERDIPF